MLHVDISSAFAASVTPTYGVTDQDFTGLRTSMKRYIGEWMQERTEGGHAWTMDAYNQSMADRMRDIAKNVKKQRIQTVVWIGIGGSALGPRVLQDVFEGPDTVEFLVVDTIDPAMLELYLTMVDWKRALIVIASKSGATLETMSAFFLFWEHLKRARGRAAAQAVFAITDANDGALHDFCSEHSAELLPIGRDVGGRYSVFSPIGLLPVALLGGDLDAFLRGAREMDVACQHTTLEDNPAALLAVTQYLLETKRGCVMRVIMPYAQKLQNLARWDQQLIAESLGKTELHNPFPVAAIGTQDQHSLLQQWMAGPHKAWHIFIEEIEKPALRVPANLPPGFGHLAGRTFGQLLDACAHGTAKGLTAAKRPHATITVPRVDAYHLGSLFFLFMAEVVLLGKLYRIDPYGQPGVELGKTITKEMLSPGM